MPHIQSSFETRLAKYVRLPYWLFLPRDDDQQHQPWPLILFLHGSGERGDDLSLVLQRGLPKEVQQRSDFPFVVLAPQCPARTIWSVHLDALHALLNSVITSYRIDPQQITITGLSMGGSGAWHMAATYPDVFAALVPICGDDYWCIGGPEQLTALQHLPIWAFHGAQDTVIPVTASERLVGAVQAIGGTACLTTYADVGHNCWNQAYATDELYTWLLQQRRGVQRQFPRD
jgi:predicted peptidase